MPDPFESSRSIVELLRATTSIGFAIIDRDLRYVLVNQVLAELNGMPVEAHIGRSIHEVLPDSDRFEALLRPVLDGGEPVLDREADIRMPVPGAPVRAFRYSYYPVRDSAGAIVGAAALVAELTDIRRMEELLARRELAFEALVENIPDIVARFDRSIRHTYVNPAAERETGLPAAAFLGKTHAELGMPPHLVAMWTERIGRVFRTGEPESIEFAYTGPAGLRYMQSRIVPEFGRDGSIASVLGITRDVTDRRRTENAQRFLAEASRVLASSLDYRTTLANIARLAVPELADWCVIHVLGEDGRLNLIEIAHSDPSRAKLARELEERFPLPPDSPVGAPLVVRTGRPSLRPEIPEWALAAAAGSDEHLRILKELGLRSSLVVPLRGREHVLGAITLVFAESGRRFEEQDLLVAEELANRSATAIENARLFREAEAARREALAADQAKSRFLAVMSHELRTPLNAIMGYCELLITEVTGPVTEAQRHQLERVRASGVHLLELIEQILAHSRLEAGRDEIQWRPADAAAIVREAAALLEPEATRKRLDFRWTGPDVVPVVTDPGKVKQILLNLLANAVKFTERGEVRLTLEAEGDDVVFTVHDTGIGIPAEQRERIYEPFTQVDQSTVRTAPGTGLGLAVARRLVELLGGSISMESEPDRGTTFTVRLPARPPSD